MSGNLLTSDEKPWISVDVLPSQVLLWLLGLAAGKAYWFLIFLCSLYGCPPPPRTVRANPQKGGIPGQFQLDSLKAGVWSVWSLDSVLPSSPGGQPRAVAIVHYFGSHLDSPAQQLNGRLPMPDFCLGLLVCVCGGHYHPEGH